MKGKIPFILFLVMFLFFYSCKKDKKVAFVDNEFKLFNLEESGWKSRSVAHNLSNISYTATEVPIQYYILKSEGNENHQKIDSIYLAHKDERVIEMEFEHINRDDLLKGDYTNMDYESSVKYMAFSIEKDFQAITQSGDTIACSGITFERNFKIAPFKRLLLHFGNIQEDEKIQLVYQDKLFGNGILKFKFKGTPIKL